MEEEEEEEKEEQEEKEEEEEKKEEEEIQRRWSACPQHPPCQADDGHVGAVLGHELGRLAAARENHDHRRAHLGTRSGGLCVCSSRHRLTLKSRKVG